MSACQPGITAGTVLSAGNVIRKAQSCCSSLWSLRTDVCLLILTVHTCVFMRERQGQKESQREREKKPNITTLFDQENWNRTNPGEKRKYINVWELTALCCAAGFYLVCLHLRNISPSFSALHCTATFYVPSMTEQEQLFGWALSNVV